MVVNLSMLGSVVRCRVMLRVMISRRPSSPSSQTPCTGLYTELRSAHRSHTIPRTRRPTTHTKPITMTGQWFLLALTLATLAATLPVVTSQTPDLLPTDNSDVYLAFVRKNMFELLRKYNASPAVLTQLEGGEPWAWRTWDANLANKEFDTMLAAVRSTFRPRIPAGDAGTALSLTNCFVDNLGTGWYRVGDVIMSQTPTRADLKFTLANRSVKADCDYWFLGTGKANAGMKHVEIEMASHLNMKSGESPVIDIAKVREFSGIDVDFGRGFWAPGLNLVVGLVSTYYQDRLISELEQHTPSFFQEQMNTITLP